MVFSTGSTDGDGKIFLDFYEKLLNFCQETVNYLPSSITLFLNFWRAAINMQ
jgi:hypothetical protein